MGIKHLPTYLLEALYFFAIVSEYWDNLGEDEGYWSALGDNGAAGLVLRVGRTESSRIRTRSLSLQC